MHTLGSPIQFPLGTEGPFYRLQLALRLAAEDRPNVIRRAVAVLGITWLPLALLWAGQGAPEPSGAEPIPAQSLFTHAAVNPGHLPYSWKVLLSGYTPEYVYEEGRMDPNRPFAALRERAHINAVARAADQMPDFSQRIRAGMPGMPLHP